MKKLVNIHKLYFALSVFFFLQSAELLAQESKTFTSIDEVLSFAKKNNYTFQNAVFQTQLADLTQKTAVRNLFNPRIPTAVQVLDNVKQQVSFLLGQIKKLGIRQIVFPFNAVVGVLAKRHQQPNNLSYFVEHHQKMEAILKTENIDKLFHQPVEFQVLKNIEFEVKKANFYL